MTISIKDIARAANVSYSTVSRALANSPRVKEETRDRIQRLAAEMGYSPSVIARSLVTRRTTTIGVVVTTITDLFFAEVIQAIEETALQHEYSVILASSGGSPQRELMAIRSLRERRVDGIILVAGCSTQESQWAQQETETPLVIINNVYREHRGVSVEIDNAAGGQMATAYLIGLGHRRVAYIAGPTREWDNAERQRGYEEAHGASGFPVDATLIAQGDGQPEMGMKAMQQLLALPAPPTAVFCYNDATAMGAVRAIRAAGLGIPQDLSVVGFDDIALAPYFEPPLTTVRQPKREMGSRAVEMVLSLLISAGPVEDCVLPGQLIIRESTMPAR